MKETSDISSVFVEAFFCPYSRIEKFRISKVYNKLYFKNIAVTEPAAAFFKSNFHLRIRRVLNRNMKKNTSFIANYNPHVCPIATHIVRTKTLVSIPLLQEIVFKTF